jgi:phosphopantothenoylcysteine synthetase/decarboxylase
LHIELRRWADVVLVAPCDANTLAKIATGICDNLVVSGPLLPSNRLVFAPVCSLFPLLVAYPQCHLLLQIK